MRSSDASAAAILRVLVQHLHQRLLGALEIAEVALEARGQAQQHVAPHLRRAIRRRRLGHRRHERVPLVGRAHQAQQLVERQLRRRVFVDRLAPTSRRPRPDRPASARRSRPGGAAAPGARSTVDHAAELHLVDLVQLLPLLADAIERLEDVGDLQLHRAAHEHPLERGARLGVARVGGQDLAIGLDRLGQIAQRQLVDLRQAERQLDDRLVVRRDADLAPDDVGQLVPLLVLAEQAIQRDQRLPVVGLAPARRGGRSAIASSSWPVSSS